MADARIYLFSMPDGRTGYLPVVPVIKDYLRHERRKADNALAEFLTLTHLNGIAKYHPQNVDSRNPARVREQVKYKIVHALDTRDEPLRNNPDGLVARKVRGLSEFCIIPSAPSQMDALTRRFIVERVFIVEAPPEDDEPEDDDDDRYDDDDDNYY